MHRVSSQPEVSELVAEIMNGLEASIDTWVPEYALVQPTALIAQEA